MKIITLCGSARFEQDFIDANRELTLRGFVVISMATLPSQAPNGAGKDWYTEDQKMTLDLVHLEKINMADAILVVGNGYIGKSTGREIAWAALQGIPSVHQSYDIHPHPTPGQAPEFPLGYVTNWDAVADRLHDEVP